MQMEIGSKSFRCLYVAIIGVMVSAGGIIAETKLFISREVAEPVKAAITNNPSLMQKCSIMQISQADGVSSLIKGRCDVLIGCELSDEERIRLSIACGKQELRQYSIGQAEVAIIANKGLQVKGVECRQLREIFGRHHEPLQWRKYGVNGGQVSCYGTGDSGVTTRIIARRCLQVVNDNGVVVGNIAFHEKIQICKNDAEVVKRVASDPDGIGYVRYTGKLSREVTVVAVNNVNVDQKGERSTTVHAREYKKVYPLTDMVTAYVLPQGVNSDTEASLFCILDRAYWKEPEKYGYSLAGRLLAEQGLSRIQEVRDGKGPHVSAIGTEDDSKAIPDLAIEYAKAKKAIQMVYVATESDMAALGAFVRVGLEATSAPANSTVPAYTARASVPASMPASAATATTRMRSFVNTGGKELLFRAEKPDDMAMKFHGEQWLALGQDGAGPLGQILAARAVALIVNKVNPLRSMTVDEAQAVFSGKIKEWGILLAGQGKISCYGLMAKDPAAAVFYKKVLPQNRFTNVNLKENTADVVEAVATDPQGIAFIDLSGIPDGPDEAQKAGVQVIRIAMKRGMEAITPTAATALDNSYVISQRLYLYVHPKASESGKDFAGFLATCGQSAATPYCDTVKSVQETFRKYGYLALPLTSTTSIPKPTAIATKPAPASNTTSQLAEPELPPARKNVYPKDPLASLDELVEALAFAAPQPPQESPEWSKLDKTARRDRQANYEQELAKYQPKDNYRGKKVCWSLVFEKVEKTSAGWLRLTASSYNGFTAVAMIPEAGSDLLLLKKRGQSIKVEGQIQDYKLDLKAVDQDEMVTRSRETFGVLLKGVTTFD